MHIIAVEFVGKGGMSHYVFQLCRALEESGAKVTLVTSGNFELDNHPHNFKVHHLFKLWDPKPLGAIKVSKIYTIFRKFRRCTRAFIYYREWLRLIFFLRNYKHALIQFGDIRFPSDLVFIYYLKLRGYTLTDICHNLEPFASGGKHGGLVRRSWLFSRVYKKIYHLFDVIFVHYSSNRDKFIKSFSMIDDKVVAIPHGNELLFQELKNPDITPGMLRGKYGIPSGSKVILFFGTLSRYKGIDILLESFAKIYSKNRDTHLVIAGFPAPDYNSREMELLAEKQGTKQAISFINSYIESDIVSHWMELASVAVFPYRLIFQSGAYHVAQSFGVPVVASNVGTFPEVIKHGKTGLLVPPGDTESLADSILSILEDANLARQISGNLLREAKDRFSWTRIATLMIRYYKQILQVNNTSTSQRLGSDKGP